MNQKQKIQDLADEYKERAITYEETGFPELAEIDREVVDDLELLMVDVTDMIDDVFAFQDKFGCPQAVKPLRLGDMDDSFHKLRKGRTQEEIREMMEAWVENQTYDWFDAHLDAMYILLGTMLQLVPAHVIREGWARVHAANMTKERATKANPGRYGEKYDVVKPAGFVAPNHEDMWEAPRE